ncbi:hypothetical protein L7F22_062369 [Adiantum nelumboides]|nr:hypothetical protein [Adiantum nelumboides]
MDLLKEASALFANGIMSNMYIGGVSVLMALLLLWFVLHSLRKRFWLLPAHPAKLLALNASTLAFVGLISKIPAPAATKDGPSSLNEYDMLVNSVLLCAMLGALFPSIATSPDLSNMWSNVCTASLLLLTDSFIILLQCHYEFDVQSPYATPYVKIYKFNESNGRTLECFYWLDSQQQLNVNFKNQSDFCFDTHRVAVQTTKLGQYITMGILLALLLVLLTQALALQGLMIDVNDTIIEQLDRLHMQGKPDLFGTKMRDESWEAVERNTCIKLMMVLTSTPQNITTRSPCTAMVGTLVLSSIVVLALFLYISFAMVGARILVICLCGFVCGLRWAIVAVQEDRPFGSLLSNAQLPSWLWKINTVQHRVKSSHHRLCRKRRQYGVKALFLYTTYVLLACCAVPANCMLVSVLWFTHITSSLLIRKLIYQPLKLLAMLVVSPIKALGAFICTLILKVMRSGSERAHPIPYQRVPNGSLGVICLKGEDAQMVRRQFVGAANRIIRNQHKNARRIKAPVCFLRTWDKSSTDRVISEILEKEGAPFVENLHVEHGFQYGWALTIISLLDVMEKIERRAFGMSQMAERAMDAYCQALEMVEVVDQEFMSCTVCSKETYATAVSVELMKLQINKSRCSWWTRKKVSLDVKEHIVEQVLKGVIEETEVDMEAFNKTRRDHGRVTASWSLQAVVSYTKHTVCQNLLRWSVGELEKANGGGGEESNGKAMQCVHNMLEHLNILIVKLLACCLLSLPAALDMRMTGVVHKGSVSKIEKGLFLICQGKHMWAELKWPDPPLPAFMGQLRQWI